MKFQSNSIFNGTITANSVADAGTNTDKFLVLNSSGVITYRTAAELYADLNIGALPAGYTETVKHQVKAGEAINKGQAVYVSSANGTNMIVSKASNATEATSSKTMGLLESTLALNGIGNVVTEGLLAGLDTTGATNAGDPVWLGTNGNLIYGLTNKPYAPANLVFIGIVTRINANNGEIYVKVQNGFELEELHNVDLKTTAPSPNEILGYNGSLWVNKTIASWLGYTPANAANIPSRTETVFTATANQTTFTVNYTVGSVEVFYNGSKMAPSEFTATNGTSIVLASGIPSGTILTVVANSIGGGINRAALSATSPISYDSGTGVFSIPAASGSQNGYLSSSDWTIFNNKQTAGNYVTTDTTQTISASKTFSSNLLQLDSGLKFKDNSLAVNIVSGYVSMCLNVVSGSNILYLTSSATTPNYRGYVFPNSSGTFALTSDFSSYVPYTGATSDINTGNFSIYSNYLDLKGAIYINGNTSNGAINLISNKGGAIYRTQNAINITPASTTSLDFTFGNASNVVKNFRLEASSLTDSTLRTYTLPDATGTLALTSNLSSYLALSGGNLTGNLGIGNSSPSYALDVSGTIRATGNLRISTGNTTGGGIILADDGDIVDLNDGYCSMRFSNGVRVFSSNGGGSAAVKLGNGGDIIASSDITAYGSPSDIRLKENIKPLEGALDKVMKLQGVSFDWREDSETRQYVSIKEDIGFIAQQVQEVIPELVRENDNGYLSLRDRGMTALLVESIKELKKENNELRDILKRNNII